MKKALGAILTLLLATGCERQLFEPEPDRPSQVDQFPVLSGFNPSDTAMVGPEGYRVGVYHDFSPYDSLTILFSAEQLDPSVASTRLRIRIGPSDYFPCSFEGPGNQIEVRIDCSTLAKPHVSALTFYAGDPDDRLRLSHLRITGWRSW